jgi:3-methylcrotonyl-CoA carboxylase alpha subunit
MLADAVRLAQRLRYRGVGTVEFLVAGDRHWFLEVNPRLQVEHPVTEEVTGIDIVELMLRVAAGEGLALTQADVRLRGHAVEARLCAEDAEHDFLPSTGEIVAVRFPGPGVRVETGVRAGSVVTPYYDSMLAKLIVHADDRDAALDRLSLALAETQVLGVTTNGGFLQQLIALPQTRDASFHTRSVDEVLAVRSGAEAAPLRWLAAAAAWWLLDARRGAGYGAWSAPDVTGWQMHAGDDPVSAVPSLLLREGKRVHEVRFGAPQPDGQLLVQVDGERVRLGLRAEGEGWQLSIGPSVELLAIARRDGNLFLQAQGLAFAVEAIDYLAQAAAAHVTSGELRTPLMGTILKTHAAVGDTLRAGDVVVTMESMKMEMKICAEHDGVLRSLGVVAGQMVERGLLVGLVEAAA